MALKLSDCVRIFLTLKISLLEKDHFSLMQYSILILTKCRTILSLFPLLDKMG